MGTVAKNELNRVVSYVFGVDKSVSQKGSSRITFK